MLSLQTIKDIEQELNRSVEILLKGGDLDAVLKEWTEEEQNEDPAVPGSGTCPPTMACAREMGCEREHRIHACCLCLL